MAKKYLGYTRVERKSHIVKGCEKKTFSSATSYFLFLISKVFKSSNFQHFLKVSIFFNRWMMICFYSNPTKNLGYKYDCDVVIPFLLSHLLTFYTFCFMKSLIPDEIQGSDWTELKSSVQFKSSLFWWTLNWTQFTFLLKELELNLVHLLSELELKWTEKFSSFFYHKNQDFLAYFWSKNTDTIGILL